MFRIGKRRGGTLSEPGMVKEWLHPTFTSVQLVQMSEAQKLPILVLVRDLMFSGRIGATARAESAAIKMFRDPAKLAGEAGKRLIVDLNLEGAIPAAIAWKQASGGEVIGFVSHVDAASIAAAREGGLDRVMALSQFVQELPALLATS